MASKVIDLQQERRRKRDRTGWTLAEIRERAAKRAAANRELEKDEPPNLASGKDMKSIADEIDDDDE